MEKKSPLKNSSVYMPNVLRWMATAALLWIGAVFAERSWGQEMDMTPPMAGVVEDGADYADVDVLYADDYMLPVCWIGFMDDSGLLSVPSMPGSDGIAFYEYFPSADNTCGAMAPTMRMESTGPYNCASSPVQIGPQGTFYYNCVRGADFAGNFSPWAASDGVLVMRRPETWFQSTPSSPTAATSASFQFYASDPSYSFECELDGSGSSFSPCVAGQSYDTLGAGEHVFRVRATDPVVGADPSPAEHHWTIDIVPPESSVTAGPSSPTAVTNATFRFSSNEAGVTFECEMDGTGFAFCLSPKTYSAIAEGAHAFRVQAMDAAGNVDPTPAEHRWAVDVTPPYFSGIESTVTRQDNRIDIFWPPAVDNVTPTSDLLYEICVSFNPSECQSSFWTFQRVIGDTTYSVTDFQPGFAYYFVVRATDAAGNRSSNNEERRAITRSAPGGPDISAGGGHSCYLEADGRIKCWGYNYYGQLGDGSGSGRRLMPVAVTSLSNATVVSAGSLHTCARIVDGTARCWGHNAYGQLGDGSISPPRRSPVAVQGISNALSVSSGLNHTCAVLEDGSAKCWGYNYYGQLGDGTTIRSSVPVAVVGLADVTQVSAGKYHTCAMVSNGAVSCWGYNNSGQLGDGTTARSPLPVRVAGLSDVLSITAGTHFTCALKSDGSAMCWGANSDGQLGDGTSTRHLVPTLVSEADPFVALSAAAQSSSHTCAVVSGGSAKCWGYNSHGQLGDGSTVTRLLPTAVSAISNAVHISAGGGLWYGHSCATLKDGTAKCWGYNHYGQLGDGTTSNRPTPVSVIGLP